MSSGSKETRTGSKILVESAVMIAVATVLSLFKFIDLPYGGSVTIASMLPIIIISYRHGVKNGLLAGLAYAILQQLLGFKTLSYVTSWQSVVAVMLLDYIVAFTVVGLGGMFRKKSSQSGALVCGTITVCILRYICHVISGATVWAGLSIPTNAALIYSIGYNATYMIPETIVTAELAYYIGSVLNFRNDSITYVSNTSKKSIPVLNWIAGLILTVAVFIDVRAVFSYLQNAETGEFDATGFAQVNWVFVIAVAAVAAVIAAVLFVISSKRDKER